MQWHRCTIVYVFGAVLVMTAKLPGQIKHTVNRSSHQLMLRVPFTQSVAVKASLRSTMSTVEPHDAFLRFKRPQALAWVWDLIEVIDFREGNYIWRHKHYVQRIVALTVAEECQVSGVQIPQRGSWVGEEPPPCI